MEQGQQAGKVWLAYAATLTPVMFSKMELGGFVVENPLCEKFIFNKFDSTEKTTGQSLS